MIFSLRVNPNFFRLALPRLAERMRKKSQQIRRYKRVLPDGRAGQISRESVEINRQSGR
jgi:hypothetical protein